MNWGHRGGALTLSHQRISWLTPNGPEEMKYRIKKYPWGCWMRISTGWAPTWGEKSEKEKGPRGPLDRARMCVLGRCWQKGTTQLVPLTWLGADFLVEKDQEYCVCEMPCNLTRYGKELSMVKIPSKASAKYLAKKFNKSEQYIG